MTGLKFLRIKLGGRNNSEDVDTMLDTSDRNLIYGSNYIMVMEMAGLDFCL